MQALQSTKLTTPFNQTTLLPTRWGHMIGLSCDPFQTGSLGIYGEWAHAETMAMCSLLKPGGVALDVGANIGTITIAFAKRVGRSGLVLAFEPQRAAFHCLCGNVALTHCLDQVRVFQAALGSSEGTIDVPRFPLELPFNVGGVRLNDPNYDTAANIQAREEVPLMTIDSLNLNRVNLVKIDVETMEAQVLAGGEKTIERCRPVIFAEALFSTALKEGSTIEDDNLAAMRNFLARREYDARFLHTALFNEDNLRFCPDSIFPGGDRNIVAIPIEQDKPGWFMKLETAYA